jgi:alpha-glucosidase
MPRMGRRLTDRAIAEAFVSPERKRLYAAPETLGQIFSFDMLFCDFDAEVFKRVIERQLQLSKQYKTGSTWVLSSHDVGDYRSMLLTTGHSSCGSIWSTSTRCREHASLFASLS